MNSPALADPAASAAAVDEAPRFSFADEFSSQWIPLLARRVLERRGPSPLEAQRFLAWAARDLLASADAWQSMRARLDVLITDDAFAVEARRCMAARDAEQSALADSLRSLEQALASGGSVAATRALDRYLQSCSAWDAFVDSMKRLAARVPDVTWLVYGPQDETERRAA